MSDSVYVMAAPDLLAGWVGPVESGRGPGQWWRNVADGVDDDSVVLAWGDARARISDIRLDLRIPQVMDRAARVLAARVGLECGATAPQWVRVNATAYRLLVVYYDHTGGERVIGRWFDCTSPDPAEAMRLALEATND